MSNLNNQELINAALKVLEIESCSINSLAARIDNSFCEACRAILACKARVIVTGIGKSGHIAKKVAATFASTGTPSFFVHPAEASHGDLGMITSSDVILALSNSGETEEITSLIPLFKRLGTKIIAMIGNMNSTLAEVSDITLDVSVAKEACSLGLAPTASTTTALAMGDALAVSVLEARGFTSDDFALSHPGGKLGRRLLVKIKDIMHTGNSIPKVTPETTLAGTILEMTNKCLGMTTIVEDENSTNILGVFTDGDLRRAFKDKLCFENTKIAEIMTTEFKSITFDVLATEAVNLMQQYKITSLPVTDHNNKLIGALNFHDLFKSGVL